MTNQSERTLWVLMPESLYDHLLDHAREKHFQFEQIVRPRLGRKSGQIVWPKYMGAAELAASVKQARDHTDTADLQPFFDDWSGEEGWYLIAHILADEVDELAKLHCDVVAAIRSTGSEVP